MTKFPTEEELKTFLKTCKQVFPNLEWRLYGGMRSINSFVEADIPGSRLKVSVGFWFNTHSAVASVSSHGTEQIFCSTEVTGQSLDEALSSLRDFLSTYAQAIADVVKVEVRSLPTPQREQYK